MQISVREQANYDALVDDHIRAACRIGLLDFGQLLRQLPCVFPTIVLNRLSLLEQSGQVSALHARAIHSSARTTQALIDQGRRLLPPPHPLDFEWRFSGNSAEQLLTEALRLSHTDDLLLLLGTPTIALEAAVRRISRRVVFIGEQNAILRAVNQANDILGRPLSIFHSGEQSRQIGEASVVLLDPPWYDDCIRSMLANATVACRIGGYILISLPPDGVRPTAHQDRLKIERFASGLGLTLKESLLSAVQYDMPYFERNALAASNCFPPVDWRRGDLLVFRKDAAHRLPSWTGISRRVRWTEAVVGRMRIFVRNDRYIDENRSAALTSLIEGDILPSIKRSEPLRQRAKIFTSGNRIYTTERPDIILAAAHYAVSAFKPFPIQERLTISNENCLHQVPRLAQVLRQLSLKEEIEECGQKGLLNEAVGL